MYCVVCVHATHAAKLNDWERREKKVNIVLPKIKMKKGNRQRESWQTQFVWVCQTYVSNSLYREPVVILCVRLFFRHIKGRVFSSWQTHTHWCLLLLVRFYSCTRFIFAKLFFFMIFIFALTLLYALSNCFLIRFTMNTNRKWVYTVLVEWLSNLLRTHNLYTIGTHYTYIVQLIVLSKQNVFIKTSSYYDMVLFFLVFFPLHTHQCCRSCSPVQSMSLFTAIFIMGECFFCHRRCYFIEFPIRCNKMTLSCVMWKLFIFIV